MFGILFSSLTLANNYVQEVNDLINSDEFKQDAQKALIIDKYYQLEIRADHDNISNYKKPYEQAATINAAKQWKSWVKDYCDKIVNGKYTQLRIKANNGNQKEADARMLMEEKLNNENILSQCQFFLERNEKIKTDAKFSYFVDEIPKGLKYYAENLDSALASGVGLKTRFSDISGSLYKTLRTVKAKIHTMISIHEILVNNETSKKWRNDFQKLNEKYTQIRLNKLDDIAKKFKKPIDLYKDSDGEQLREKITSLYHPRDHQVEIILNDNSIRHFVVMLDAQSGTEYDAIAFYALVEKNGNRDLHYAWYQKDTQSKEEKVVIVTSESFGNISAKKNKKNNHKKDRAEDIAKRKADNDAQVSQQIAQINAQRDQLLEQASGQSNNETNPTSPSNLKNKSSNFSLIALMTSLLMIISGFLITRKTTLSLIPEETAQKIGKQLDKTAPYQSVLGFILIFLGMYGLVISIFHLNILSLFISLVAVLSGFLLSLNKILNFNLESFKGNEQTAEKIRQTIRQHQNKFNFINNQSLPIGIAAIVSGLFQLLF